MINLIPPQAKKKLKAEYWVRVFSVWLMLWSAALLVGAGILLPAYVLIDSQVTVYEASAAEASLKVASYENVSTSLVQASQQAKIINDAALLPVFSEYIDLFSSLENKDVQITDISFSNTEVGIAPMVMSGMASDRHSLALFRDRLLADDRIVSVDLPISNLASDKDIKFNITVNVNNSET